MAFGLFKKNNYADTIYINANIHTLDEEYPLAEAVACKDGIITAVGNKEYMEEFTGPNTNVIDLDGKHLYPGFINTRLPLIYDAFRELCLFVDPSDDLDYVLEQLADYSEERLELFTLFVYGFNAKIFDGIDDEELIARLDEIAPEIPVLLLDDLCHTVKMNSVAKEILMTTAEEECVSVITLPYIINLFLPFEYDDIKEVARDVMDRASDMGFTSVFTLGTPDFMDESFLYALLAVHAQDDLLQRYFFALLQKFTIGNGAIGYRLVNRKTACVELGDQVSYTFLNVRMDGDFDFEVDALAEMITDAAERGFNIHIDCPTEETAKIAYEAMDNAREKGFVKQLFNIGIAESIEADWADEFIHFDTIERVDYFNLENETFAKGKTAKEALLDLTVNAARMIGMDNMLGTIEPDKYADFTVFDDDILEYSIQKFAQPHCSMTIVGGQVVYDAQLAADNEMYNMISSQQF